MDQDNLLDDPASPVMKKRKRLRANNKQIRDDNQDEELDLNSPTKDLAIEGSPVQTPATTQVPLSSEPSISGWINPRYNGPSVTKVNMKHDTSATQSARPKKSRSTDDDESEMSEHSGSSDESNSYDEEEDDVVSKMLLECETIALKMRSIISTWNGSNKKVGSGGAEERVAVTTIQTHSGVELVSQKDIHGLDEALKLKPYQMVGVNWLHLLHQQGLNGVLADEMGLGKTVQTIAFIAWLATIQAKTGDRKGPQLIVVPASVLSNWKREFQKFCPALRAEVYHGSQAERREIQSVLRKSSDFDVLLTTYSYFERDNCKDDRSWIRRFKFCYLILDEAHSIKNSKSSRFSRLMAVKSKFRLLLSGTPIQNDLRELLALLSFVMPSIFDCNSEKLTDWFENADDEGARLRQIKSILGPFILRRVKAEVLDQLSEKTTNTEMVKLQTSQRSIYDGLLRQEARRRSEKINVEANSENKERDPQEAKKKGKRSALQRELALLGHSAGPATKSRKETGESSASQVKHLFTDLRKAANHPLLLRRRYVDNQGLDTMANALHALGAFGDQCTTAMVRKELEGYSDFELHCLCTEYGSVKDLRSRQLEKDVLLDSAKMKCLRNLLPSLVEKGHRMLLFSQWTKLLDLLEILMEDLGLKFLRLDGSTAVKERQELIDEYNRDKDINVFLLSTRAGGLGLNLTAADTVILHDLDFNPHNDRQAEDRCHRIGQTKPVTVYKLVAEGTVDEDIYRLGQRKQNLDAALLGDKNEDESLDAQTMEDILSRALAELSATPEHTSNGTGAS